MSVTVKDVEHIAKLARLQFSEQEKQEFTHQLNEILAYVEQLNTLETDGVEPLSHVVELKNVVREDQVKPGLTNEEALQNVPARSDKFFRVPKVISE